MRVGRPRAFLGAALLAVLCAAPSSAQQNGDEQARAQAQILTHIGHVADSFSGTPEGQGLLPTARAEAEIVVRHADLAARDTTDLDAMKMHVEHVLHAVDPSLVPGGGPGLGYGMKPAAAAVDQHMNLTHDVEGASRRVRDYSHRVAVSARNTVARADSIIALGRQIRDADTASQAAPLVMDLKGISDQLIPGVDENGDGGIGWRRGEGGLEQARQNLAVLKREASAAADSASTR